MKTLRALTFLDFLTIGVLMFWASCLAAIYLS